MDAAAALASPGGSGRIGGAEVERADVDRSVPAGLPERRAELVEEVAAFLFRVLQDLLHQTEELVVTPSEHFECVGPRIADNVLELVGRDPVGICEDAEHRVVARLLGRVFLGSIEARPAKPSLLERKVCLAEQEVRRVQRLIVLHPLARLSDELELLFRDIVLPRDLIASIPFEELVPGMALVDAVELRVCALDRSGTKLHELRQDRTRKVAHLVAFELEKLLQRDARRLPRCVLPLLECVEVRTEMLDILVLHGQVDDLFLDTLVLGLVLGAIRIRQRNSRRRRDEDFASKVALVLNLDLESQIGRVLAAVGEGDELSVSPLRLQ